MKDSVTKIIYILITALIFSIALFLIANRNPQTISQVLLRVTPTSKDTIATPFMIYSLRKRSYEGGKIVVENKAYETNTFTAYVVSYPSDGLKLFALLSVPKQKDKTFPILIMNHGYIPPDQYSSIYAYKNPFDFFASNGFIVLKPDYRANGSSEGDKKDPLNRLSYPIDVLNLISSLPTLSSLPILSSPPLHMVPLHGRRHHT